MFNAFYGLAFNPFDKQSLKEKDCFLSADHNQMVSRLSYLKDVRGIGVFTAPPGFGKSFALRCFAKSLNPNLFQMEYLCLSTISVTEFYKQFCMALGVDTDSSKTIMFKTIQDRVYYLFKEKRRPFVLAIDEAQYLNASILKDLKILLNHGYDSLNCFTLVLCGESYLNAILEKPVHEALRQRISVHYNFGGLSDEEVPLYIAHKLHVAGGADSILGPGTVGAIHGFAQGNPRLIDNLMTDVLTLGAQADKPVIDSEIVLAAINNQALR
ncbi:MAG: AAA family ATPase [Peptococcaceae bacterium]|jgi:type II secretory pathway predicted ATPase ExeA|nr:AAA family ATPase [Peptococcaceae bacterium]